MKSVLAIFGLAIAFILVSLLIQKPKDLTPRPQDKIEPNQPQPPAPSGNEQNKTPQFLAPKAGMITADMKIKNVGTITFEFYPKAAPNSVSQITDLIHKGFYDGILIHRVEKPIVVQFGRPLTKTQGIEAPETDGGVPPLKFEQNDLPHIRGSVGLARTQDRDSATCQLFIDLQDMPQWNGDYCVIGRVVKGMEQLDKVNVGDKIESFKIRP